MTVVAPAHWLEPALRADPFVADRLIVLDGWRDRGRPGAFLPSGIIQHHTACMCNVGHDPQSCINGILAGNSVAPGPVSQLLGTFTPPGVRFNGSNHDPRIVLIAAGRCNHAGVGQYRWGAPAGNGSSIGIEWCGPALAGMPPVVVELYARVVACILRNRAWSTEQTTTHWEYALPQGRKIDTSGPWAPEPALGRTSPQSPARWRALAAHYLIPNPTTVYPGGTMLHTLDPHAVLVDTRKGIGAPARRISAGETLRVQIPDVGPDAPRTAIVNVTIVEPSAPGYVQVTGRTFGDASTGNFGPNQPPEATPCIAAIVDGAILVRIDGAPGLTAHVLVALQGVVE